MDPHHVPAGQVAAARWRWPVLAALTGVPFGRVELAYAQAAGDGREPHAQSRHSAAVSAYLNARRQFLRDLAQALPHTRLPLRLSVTDRSAIAFTHWGPVGVIDLDDLRAPRELALHLDAVLDDAHWEDQYLRKRMSPWPQR